MDTTGDRGAGRVASVPRVLENQDRQRELYGEPIGDRVRRVQAALAISQARLAEAIRLSPAMLSQLVSGRRVKIGNPAVLARLLLLDERSQRLDRLDRLDRDAVGELLSEVRDAQPYLSTSEQSELLWAAGGAAGLAAAADALRQAFPNLAELLGRAAAGTAAVRAAD